jgi:hypothetical protein
MYKLQLLGGSTVQIQISMCFRALKRNESAAAGNCRQTWARTSSTEDL